VPGHISLGGGCLFKTNKG